MKTRVFLDHFTITFKLTRFKNVLEIYLTNSCKELNDRLSVALRTIVYAETMTERETREYREKSFQLIS